MVCTCVRKVAYVGKKCVAKVTCHANRRLCGKVLRGDRAHEPHNAKCDHKTATLQNIGAVARFDTRVDDVSDHKRDKELKERLEHLEKRP